MNADSLTPGLDLEGACRWCGCLHGGTCPRVKKIVYGDDGTVKEVEFWGIGERQTKSAEAAVGTLPEWYRTS
jgi:hypothetical protein